MEPAVPHVEVVLAQCGSITERLFGIRMEEGSPRNWAATWAFAISGGAARREGYGSTVLRGSFTVPDTFPGCPACGRNSIFSCACGRSSCWDGETKSLTCPWCKKPQMVGGPATLMHGSNDRS